MDVDVHVDVETKTPITHYSHSHQSPVAVRFWTSLSQFRNEGAVVVPPPAPARSALLLGVNRYGMDTMNMIHRMQFIVQNLVITVQ